MNKKGLIELYIEKVRKHQKEKNRLYDLQDMYDEYNFDSDEDGFKYANELRHDMKEQEILVNNAKNEMEIAREECFKNGCCADEMNKALEQLQKGGNNMKKLIMNILKPQKILIEKLEESGCKIYSGSP